LRASVMAHRSAPTSQVSMLVSSGTQFMFADVALWSIVFIACGLGLVVIGAAHSLMPWRPRVVRWLTSLTALAVALAVAGVASFTALSVVALIIAAAFGAVRVVRSPLAIRLATATTAIVKSPAFGWCFIGIAGVALTALGALGIDQNFDVAELQDVSHVQDMVTMPAFGPEPAAFAQSDCGSAIALMAAADERDPDQLRTVELQILEGQHWNDCVIRRRPATDNCNCHGWVFTGGRYWVRPDEVEAILSENGYEPVTTPRPGDLTVYRNSGEEICHTAIVRAIMDDGVPMVEGKWGWMGVFLHRVGDSCYGKNFTYYHSERAGHLLAGLPAAETRGGPPIRTE
jgi:hypothetical protein